VFSGEANHHSVCVRSGQSVGLFDSRENRGRTIKERGTYVGGQN
jgi:hypothetical protein